MRMVLIYNYVYNKSICLINYNLYVDQENEKVIIYTKNYKINKSLKESN